MNSTIAVSGLALTTMQSSGKFRSYYRGDWIVHSLILFICVVGLSGNSAVLWILGFRTRRNAFSVYILNLAGADFLFLGCCAFWALSYLFDSFYYYSFLPAVRRILSSLTICAYLTSMSILSAISMERCVSVLWPIWYRCRRPRHLSVTVCALLWAVSLLLGYLHWDSCFLLHDPDLRTCPNFSYITLGWLIFLFLILFGSSLALVLRICSSGRKLLTRLYVTVLLTVLVFFLCGMPYGIYRFILVWLDNFYSVVPQYFIMVTLFLSRVNSCANPIIYFFVGSFRQWWQGQSLKHILQRALQDTHEAGVSGDSLAQETLEMSERNMV